MDRRTNAIPTVSLPQRATERTQHRHSHNRRYPTTRHSTSPYLTLKGDRTTVRVFRRLRPSLCAPGLCSFYLPWRPDGASCRDPAHPRPPRTWVTSYRMNMSRRHRRGRREWREVSRCRRWNPLPTPRPPIPTSPVPPSLPTLRRRSRRRPRLPHTATEIPRRPRPSPLLLLSRTPRPYPRLLPHAFPCPPRPHLRIESSSFEHGSSFSPSFLPSPSSPRVLLHPHLATNLLRPPHPLHSPYPPARGFFSRLPRASGHEGPRARDHPPGAPTSRAGT